MSADQPNDPASWMTAMQKAQSDWMRQWTQWSGGLSSQTPPPGAAGAGNADGAAAAEFTQRILGQMEQSLGVSRAMWDLLGKAAALSDVGQRAHSFNDGLQQLQSQFMGFFTPAAPFAAGGQMSGFSPMPGFPPMPGMGLPGLGPAREQQESMDRLSALATRVMQAQATLNAQWGQVVSNALRELGGKLAPGLQSGKMPASLREVYDLWIETAEKVYAGAAHGSAFVQAQSELANTVSQLRIAQRDWFEEMGRAFDLPTRAELNSLHQQVKQLKEAVQKLTGK